MRRTVRAAAVVLTVIFVLFVAMSLIFMAAEAHHDCTGEDCPFCQLLASMTNALRLTVAALAVLYFFFAAERICGYIRTLMRNAKESTTFVTLKTKLSN